MFILGKSLDELREALSDHEMVARFTFFSTMVLRLRNVCVTGTACYTMLLQITSHI